MTTPLQKMHEQCKKCKHVEMIHVAFFRVPGCAMSKMAFSIDDALDKDCKYFEQDSISFEIKVE